MVLLYYPSLQEAEAGGRWLHSRLPYFTGCRLARTGVRPCLAILIVYSVVSFLFLLSLLGETGSFVVVFVCMCVYMCTHILRQDLTEPNPLLAKAQGVFLSLPPKCWGYRSTLPCLAFSIGAGDLFSFTNWAISPGSETVFICSLFSGLNTITSKKNVFIFLLYNW